MKKHLTSNKQKGFVLITALMVIALFLTLLASYYSTTFLEITASGDSAASADGFFAAEAGLNVKAEAVRSIFLNYNAPTGTAPNATNPCTDSNNGTGDFACQTLTYNGRTVKTYMTNTVTNPVSITIPQGELYQNLNAQEYRYTAVATATNVKTGLKETQLELRFKTRLVPMFQFAMFFNKDLELLPQETMNLSGPMHANGNMYLNSSSAVLTINGQLTSSGTIYRGRKDTSSCDSSSVRVYNPTTATNFISSCSSRVAATNTDISPFNGMIVQGVQPLTVPDISVLNPTSASAYWANADLRLVLSMNASDAPTTIQVRTVSNVNDSAATTTLNACTGITGASNNRAVGIKSIYNPRENKVIRLLDIDTTGLFNCLKSSNWFGTGKTLDETSSGGLVIYATVEGPNSNAAANSYGIRLRNGTELKSTVSGAPRPRAITFATDQAGYILGNFNSVNKIPVAFLSDSMNILSASWNDANCLTSASCSWSSRNAGNTTINAAMLSGTETTGVEGSAGHGGTYGGGAHNFPRLQENWTGDTLTIRGSFVSLGEPRHANGLWKQGCVGSTCYYEVPNRNFDYDTSFNSASNLPPLSLRFVYLKQELFVRDFF